MMNSGINSGGPMPKSDVAGATSRYRGTSQESYKHIEFLSEIKTYELA